MNRYMKRILSLCLCALMLIGTVCGCQSDGAIEGSTGAQTETAGATDLSSTPDATPESVTGITLTAFAGAQVDVLDPTVRSYIDQRNDPKMLATMLKTEQQAQKALIKQTVTFTWTAQNVAGPYTLSVADNQDFKNAFVIQVTGTSCSDVGIFIPGKTYYWKVSGSDGTESSVDTFTVKDGPSRLITAGSMLNMRDLGGWPVASGKKIAYGKLFRGDDPRKNGNDVTAQVFSYLGINGQVDLRYDSKDNQNYMGADKPFLNAGILYFYQVIPGEYDYKKETTDNIGKIFKFLADESNYPVYLHCSWGKDRTGTICYLIGGLLGMSYEDLMCDYELSSYATKIDSQPRNEIISDGTGGWMFKDAKDDPWGAVGRLHYVILEKYPAGTLAESIEKYLISDCGVTAEEIAAIRNIVLE